MRLRKDTSRGGHNHKARYRDVAVELGLEVSRTPAFGWASTQVRPETAEAYADQLERLGAVLTVYRVAEGKASGLGGRWDEVAAHEGGVRVVGPQHPLTARQAEVGDQVADEAATPTRRRSLAAALEQARAERRSRSAR